MSKTTENDADGPGYKDYHWHGRLFFEIDRSFVDFSQPKYNLDNINTDDAVYFHFHDSAHGPNEWSNEKEIVTFARALNLLPEIEYDRSNGEHAITYEGTTFDASTSSNEISIHRGTEQIDPITYEVSHDDNFWVNIQTDTDSGSDGDERTGALFVDVNNRRVDLETETDSDRFTFPDGGPSHVWSSTGEPVTLEYALNALSNVSYERESNGEHVIIYEAADELGGTYRGVNDETQMIVRQRSTPIDPTTHELQDSDAIWVYVHTSNAPDNEH